jgi:hypothetical protein
MKSGLFILLISSIIILGINQTLVAQTTVNFTKLIEDKYTRTTTDPRVPHEIFQDVTVRYESPTTILINGNLILGNGFNSRLWDAMDMLKSQYGFKLQQVMTSGEGSNQNPTSVYILMTK